MINTSQEFRNQLFFSSLEDTILPENPVCFIDAFVEALSLETLGLPPTIKRGRSVSFETKNLSLKC
jgi:hypothetical protein